MNYDQIFKPETLSKLNRQSADNLRRVKEEYNLMDQMGYMRLIQDISQIEEPYKEQLEQLAVNMVKELYPVIDEQGIKIDAGLTDLNGTRTELDEIKVNNPALITPIKVESKEKLEQILKILQNKGYSWGGDSDQGFFEPNSIRPTKYPIYIVKDWGQNKIDFTYPPVHPAHKSVNLSESISPEGRRRVINSITQGAALKGAFAFYLFKDHLDAIDPTLIDKYNEVMKRTFGVFDDDNVVAMMMALMAQGVDLKGVGGGSSKVILPKNDNLNEQQDSGITIRARAICFPMLVHEIIKGLYELISLQGFKGNKEQNQAVVDKVDKLEHEPHDLKYGQHIFEALNDVYFEYGGDDSRVREYFFQEIYQLEDEDFIDYVENAINGTLTPQEKSWTKQILKEIQHDLKGDDYDQHGLDEIKVNKPNPNQQYYSKYPGLEEKCNEYNPFTILDSKMDPGYGYQHMKIFQIKFNSDNRYGLFIWDGNNKSFQEEPGEYEDYNLTTDEVERKFGFKHTISEIKVNKPNSIIYKSKTQDDSFGWLYLNDEIISEFSYLSDGKIKIDEHDYYNSIDPKFRKLFSRIPGTMYGFALNKPFTIKKQDPIGEIKVNNPIGIKAEPRDDPQSPLRNERAFIIKIDEKNKLKLMKGKDYYYLFQGIGENSPKLELIKSFLSKKGIPFTQVASSAPGRVNIHIPVDKIKIKLDESILNKGLIAGLLLTAGLSWGQIKPEYKAKIDSIQKTELSPQDKRAEIQKIVQLNRDEISGKKREEFLRTMKAAGFTNEEEYKKYLVKNAKKKDAGLDGLQVGNANKRGETKGSCSTGETNKGESLKDTK